MFGFRPPIPDVVSADGKKYRMVACVLRQPAAGGGWYAIDDAGHEPLNVASVSNDTQKIIVPYTFVAKKVISLVACPDETFVQGGYLFGASVMGDRAEINISAPTVVVDGLIQYNGTDWIIANAKGNPVFTSFIDGDLKISHDSMTATTAVSVSPLNSPYLLKVKYSGYNYTTVQFTDYSGTVITTPDTNMVFTLLRQQRYVRNNINPNDLKSDAGNIWVLGIMEV